MLILEFATIKSTALLLKSAMAYLGVVVMWKLILLLLVAVNFGLSLYPKKGAVA